MTLENMMVSLMDLYNAPNLAATKVLKKGRRKFAV